MIATCHCRGRDNLCDEHWARDVDAHCPSKITQEDLLCDSCREHGCSKRPRCMTCELWS